MFFSFWLCQCGFGLDPIVSVIRIRDWPAPGLQLGLALAGIDNSLLVRALTLPTP